jgi:hypothetical protein
MRANDGLLPLVLAMGAVAGVMILLTPRRAAIRVAKGIRTRH